MNGSHSIQSINIPMLDLYGSEDLPGVMSSASKRAKAAINNKNYSQKVVNGANHFFDGKNTELLSIISDFLAK